jgi:hypothetical protein
MSNATNTVLPYSFSACPCCGRVTMSGESGICPVLCPAYTKAANARDAALQAANPTVDLDAIVLVW